MRPSDIITAAFRDTLKPYLLEHGFQAQGTTFVRAAGETAQTVEIQRHGVGGAQGMVYLNGRIHVVAVDELLSRAESPGFARLPCVILFRPHQLDQSIETPIHITQASDPGEVAAEAVRGIDVLLAKMATITTTADAVDHLSGLKLTSYEGVFAWYLEHGQLDRARAFVMGLYQHFGAQPRWEKLAPRIDAVAAEVLPDTPWRTWLISS